MEKAGPAPSLMYLEKIKFQARVLRVNSWRLIKKKMHNMILR